MPPSSDTIAALATPAGTAALAVVRVSGPDTARIAREVFGAGLRPRLARHADYRDRGGVVIDDVLATYFAGPRSYTGEDVLEVSSHGNPFIAQKILEDLFARGCRPAEPGEFTQRAFLSGRMDLSQAEAVMDLIHARSDRALEAANRQLRGALGRRMEALVDGLLGILARVEAYIDFPEEDLPAEDKTLIQTEVGRLLLDTNKLMATSHYGALLRDGIRTVIVGAPNAGKSSLLNRLVGRDRALVSPTPGTTRDFIEERVLIDGHALRLIDTAGLNPEPGEIERLGIGKTLEQLAEADLVLFVVDATAPHHPALPPDVTAPVVGVRNKIDLPGAILTTPMARATEVVDVSAATGGGVETLLAALARRAEQFRRDAGADEVAINARHAQALAEARECLAAAAAKLAAGAPAELLASDLRGVLDAYGRISGRIDNEQMLDRLFATFCIGK